MGDVSESLLKISRSRGIGDRLISTQNESGKKKTKVQGCRSFNAVVEKVRGWELKKEANRGNEC